jgi:hypothetical protein
VGEPSISCSTYASLRLKFVPVRRLTEEPPSGGPTPTSSSSSPASVLCARPEGPLGVDLGGVLHTSSTETWNNCSPDAELAGQGRSGGPRLRVCICVGEGIYVGLSGGEGGAGSGRSPCRDRLGVDGPLRCVMVIPVCVRV